MTAFALMMLVFFHCGLCNGLHGRGLSTSNKMEIACAQLRASGCSPVIGWDLRCAPVRVSVSTKAMKPGYRSFMVGKENINVKRHVNARSWDAALRVCRSEGGSLVKIDSEEKERAIKKKLKMKGSFLRTVKFWMGLRYFKVKRKFLWTDKTPLDYENWGISEPSHTRKDVDSTVHTDTEDCVALVVTWFRNIYWNDRFCSKTSGFICEVL